MKKVIVLMFCVLLLSCLLISGCTKKEKEMSTTYWEAVNVAPVKTGQIPPNTWKLEIKDAKNIVDVEQTLNKNILELLKNHPSYHVASSNINLEIKVTLAPNDEKRN